MVQIYVVNWPKAVVATVQHRTMRSIRMRFLVFINGWGAGFCIPDERLLREGGVFIGTAVCWFVSNGLESENRLIEPKW